jgi:L-serine deaminase
MKYKSVFDIIGPVMIGPSSSHTAGAARIGQSMPTALRETGKGGLAATPTGRQLKAKIFGMPLKAID